jgi:hypothetical protein
MAATLIGGGFSLVGAIFISVALWQVLSPHSRALSRSAKGKVVANRSEEMSEGDFGYVSVVRFTSDDGREIEIEGAVISRPAALAIGDVVKVSYNPSRPNDARLDTYWERWFLPTIIGLLGAVFSAIGFATIIFYQRLF